MRKTIRIFHITQRWIGFRFVIYLSITGWGTVHTLKTSFSIIKSVYNFERFCLMKINHSLFKKIHLFCIFLFSWTNCRCVREQDKEPPHWTRSLRTIPKVREIEETAFVVSQFLTQNAFSVRAGRSQGVGKTCKIIELKFFPWLT